MTTQPSDSPPVEPPKASNRPAPRSFSEEPMFPYILPFGVFMVFIALGSSDGESQYVLYPVSFLAVAYCIWHVRDRLPSFKISAPVGSIIVGLLGFALWVSLEPHLVDDPEARTGGYDPHALSGQYGAWMVWVLLGFKFAGFVITTPIMEELFWRGFLMRFLINPKGGEVPRPTDKKDIMAWVDYDLARGTNDDFEQVPMGTYGHVSFWLTTGAFAMVHGAHWPLALMYGVLIGWWFVRTKNLGNAILVHAVTNFALGFYTVLTAQWWWW